MNRQSIEKQIEDIINFALKEYRTVKENRKPEYIQGISNLILEACKMLYAGNPEEAKASFERYLNKFKDGISNDN